MTPSRPWQPPLAATGAAVAFITPRQADVLTGICHGLTNFQIGRRLDIAEDTVKSHMRGLLRSLGARDRCHAVALTVTGQVTVHVREAQR